MGRICQWLLLAIAVLAAAATPVAAETYYVAPTGTDTNDCLSPLKSCATFQHTVDLCPLGKACAILPAPGRYSQKTNVTYYKLIWIIGPQGQDGSCIDRSAIIIDDRIEGIGPRGAIFAVQDHAIFALSCVTVRSYAQGTVGFFARQFGIGDVNYVDFLDFSDGVGASAAEGGKINLYSPGILGDAAGFAFATGLSQINIGGTLRLADKIKFSAAFLSSSSGSLITMHPDAIVGSSTFLGASYQCSYALIDKNVVLPGGDTPAANNENCTVIGLAPVEARHRPLDQVRREQRRNDRIRDILIGVLAVLTLINVALWWRVRRGRGSSRIP
jgi:hypothetical protein